MIWSFFCIAICQSMPISRILWGNSFISYSTCNVSIQIISFIPYVIRQISWSILKEWEEKKKKQNTLFQFLWIKKKGNGEMCHKISNQKVQKYTYDKYRYKYNRGYQRQKTNPCFQGTQIYFHLTWWRVICL